MCMLVPLGCLVTWGEPTKAAGTILLQLNPPLRTSRSRHGCVNYRRLRRLSQQEPTRTQGIKESISPAWSTFEMKFSLSERKDKIEGTYRSGRDLCVRRVKRCCASCRTDTFEFATLISAAAAHSCLNREAWQCCALKWLLPLLYTHGVRGRLNAAIAHNIHCMKMCLRSITKRRV